MRAALLVAVSLAALVAADPITCTSPATIPPLPTGTTLKQVQVLIRHGQRALASTDQCWPNDNAVYACNLTQITGDSTELVGQELQPQLLFRKAYEPNFEYLYGDCGIGQLTLTGFQQETANGQALRAAYIDGAKLLSPYLTEDMADDLYLRSDDQQRTIMSGQALFGGMYPSQFVNFTQPNSRVLTWITRDGYYETIYPNPSNCPDVHTAYQAAVASAEAQALFTKYGPLFATISQAVGEQYASNDHDPLYLYDCMLSHVCQGHPLPAALNSSLTSSAMDMINSFEVLLHSYNSSAFAKSGMALLVFELAEAMKAVIDGSDDTQLFRLYSGHDLGPIMPLLASFGVWDGLWAPFASMVTFELHQSNANASAYSVRLTYNGNVMKIPGCADEQGLCAWESFVQIARGIADYGLTCTVGPGRPAWGAPPRRPRANPRPGFSAA